jgi:hypothetical protein
MASTILVGGADVAGLWSEYILRDFVPGLKRNLFLAEYAEPARIPRGAGAFVGKWNVPTMRTGSVTALSGGTSGVKTDMVTITAVTAGLTTYGEWFELEDLATESVITEAIDAYREITMESGARALDLLVYNAAVATTNFLHAGDSTISGVTLAAGDQLKAKDLPVIGGFFRKRNNKGWPQLSNDFMLAIDPDVETTFVTHVSTSELSWTEVNKHVPEGFKQLIDNHRFVGRLNGVSVLRSTTIGTITEDVAAFRNIALARYGVGWLGLGENGPKAPQIKFKRPGPQSTNDPLDMVNTMGWKLRAVGKLLDSNRALVVYSAV